MNNENADPNQNSVNEFVTTIHDVPLCYARFILNHIVKINDISTNFRI